MFTFSKKTRKKFLILFFIFLFHFVSIIISSLNDRALHDKHFSPIGKIKLSDLKYWFWFFTWYSAWTSLLTIPWVVYKFFSLFLKKKSTYIEQLTDLIITQANLISGVIFCCGGFMLGKPHRPIANYPMLGSTKTIYVWLFYNFFWHVLAPGLVFYYFWKYCQINKLLKRKKLTFIGYLFNPSFYIFYVLIRPEIKIINYHNKLKGPQPYNYPSDYPYAPFFWIMGKNCSQIEEKLTNNWFFWHKWSPWLKFLFWFSSIIILTYAILIFTFNLLIKVKTKQNSQINNFNQLDN